MSSWLGIPDPWSTKRTAWANAATPECRRTWRPIMRQSPPSRMFVFVMFPDPRIWQGSRSRKGIHA